MNRLIPIRVRPPASAVGPARDSRLKGYPVAIGLDREVVVETYIGPFSRLDRYDWTGLDELRPAERVAVSVWLERAIENERQVAYRRRERREEQLTRARCCLERMVSAEDLARLDRAALQEHETRNRVRMRGGRAKLPDHPHTRRWALPLFRSFFQLDDPSRVLSFASMSDWEREIAYREFSQALGDWEAGRFGVMPPPGEALRDQALKVLGLPPRSSLGQVKDRFRELAKRYHPDRPTGNSEKMKVFSEAYTRIVRSRPGPHSRDRE